MTASGSGKSSIIDLICESEMSYEAIQRATKSMLKEYIPVEFIVIICDRRVHEEDLQTHLQYYLETYS